MVNKIDEEQENTFFFIYEQMAHFLPYLKTTSYLLIAAPRELFLMANPFPMTTQVLHSRLQEENNINININNKTLTSN